MSQSVYDSQVVVGSKALLQWFPDARESNLDTDIVTPFSNIDILAGLPGKRAAFPLSRNSYVIKFPNRIIDIEIAWPGSTGEALIDLVKNEKGPVTRFGMIPSIHLLYALKMSHRYLKNSPHFLKTMRDIQYLRNKGAQILPEHESWYRLRIKETYDYGHPSLARGKKDFFRGDGVRYVYDHDSIHRAVAIEEEPAYESYKADGAEVMTSKEKFLSLPERIRLNGVYEETVVLALERSQIPFPTVEPKKSFDIALMKVCTSITSGWFREYAWEHYDAVQRMYDPEYVNKFRSKVDQGLVAPYVEVADVEAEP